MLPATTRVSSLQYRTFGGGLEVAAGPGALTLDGRYDLGFTDITASAGYQVRLR